MRAVRTFAHQDGVVHIGEEFRGGDPVVEKNWSAFVPGETLDQELENPFDALPPPPEFTEPVEVRDISIPVHRQVRCIVDVSVPVPWAADSPGRQERDAAAIHSQHSSGRTDRRSPLRRREREPGLVPLARA